MRLIGIIFVSLLALVSTAEAKLKVVTSTSDIRAIVQEVAGDRADVKSIAKGSQDPHFVEAKPSYMVLVRDADLVVVNGLSLEIGWMPSLVRGARNPKVVPGERGYLDLGESITPLGKVTGKISRAQGDVHPEGNPHYTLDPVRNAELGLVVANRLGELDPASKSVYLANAEKFKKRTEEKTAAWKKRIEATGMKSVITYHPSLNYFLERFGLNSADNLEDKPGIPPSAQHILKVISLMKGQGISLILVDNFFDTKIAERVVSEVPKARVASVGIAVDSSPDLKTLDDVTEQLVKAIEGK